MGVLYVGNHVANSACKSKVRMLRVAGTHYPSQRNLLNNVYIAVKCHLLIYDQYIMGIISHYYS